MRSRSATGLPYCCAMAFRPCGPAVACRCGPRSLAQPATKRNGFRDAQPAGVDGGEDGAVLGAGHAEVPAAWRTTYRPSCGTRPSTRSMRRRCWPRCRRPSRTSAPATPRAAVSPRRSADSASDWTRSSRTRSSMAMPRATPQPRSSASSPRRSSGADITSCSQCLGADLAGLFPAQAGQGHGARHRLGAAAVVRQHPTRHTQCFGGGV